MRVAVCLVAAAVCASAGEYAVLTTGFRVYAERHERAGDIVRLYTKDGVTEFPASLVAGFESEEAAPAAAPVVPAPATAPQPPPPSIREMVRESALRNGLPPSFVESVAAAESAFQPDAVSPKGAIGVMQLMPSTARALSADPRDPAQNIEAGTKLLRELLIKYGGDVAKALAAYNAGPGAVSKYNGLPPYRETVTYVDRVIRRYKKAGGS